MFKKKEWLCFVFLVFFVGLSFAGEKAEKLAPPGCNWFSDSKVWSLSVFGDSVNYKDFEHFQFGTGISGMLDMTELKTKIGIYLENHKIHGTAQLSYGPTLFSRLNPGVLLQNHFCRDSSYYFDYDLLIGPFVEYKPNTFFKLNCTLMFQQKFSFIENLPSSQKLVYNCCPAFNLDFSFYPLDRIFIDLTFSSYTFYRYFLFFAPDTRLALDFSPDKNLTLEVAAEVQAVDFFTLSANLNKLVFSAGATWRF